MGLDLRTFFQATNPARTLNIKNPEDEKCYIDFASVRGGKIIDELKYNITYFATDDRTCILFTGHIGCGKSTELLRLKAELEDEGYHVVYFESSDDLEMTDVDISDIMLAIARRRVVTILAVIAIACHSLPSQCSKLVTVIAFWECDRISCRSNTYSTQLTLFPLPSPLSPLPSSLAPSP